MLVSDVQTGSALQAHFAFPLTTLQVCRAPQVIIAAAHCPSPPQVWTPPFEHRVAFTWQAVSPPAPLEPPLAP